MAAIKKSIRKRSMAAAYTLLGIIPPIAAQAAGRPSTGTDTPPAAERWSFDSSVLQYTEAERIRVTEPQFGVRRDFVDNRSLDILVTVDTISGATPLGTLPATPNTAPHTTTSPSGHMTNPVVGKVPLTSIVDHRYALGATWRQPWAHDYAGTIGGNISKESDYLSIAAPLSIARDFNQKDTTLSLGLSPEYDVSSPRNGLPVAFATQQTPNSLQKKGHASKSVVGLLAGLTQVVTRRTLMQLNYTYTHENGYLNDPYKLLSVVDPLTGDPLSSVYEKRPSTRSEHSLYGLLRHNLIGADVFSLGLRFYSDDWGIRSQTIDFTYRRQSNDHFYWEPHMRYYHQSAADFFQVGLISGAIQPAFAGSDQRLADLNGVTFGLRFGYTFPNASELILRAEFYTQTGDSHPKAAVGLQKAYDLFPTLNASIYQIEYRFDPARLFVRKRSIP